jgi:hypothetical protein
VDFINEGTEEQIADVLWRYGEEQCSLPAPLIQ